MNKIDYLVVFLIEYPLNKYESSFVFIYFKRMNKKRIVGKSINDEVISLMNKSMLCVKVN